MRLGTSTNESCSAAKPYIYNVLIPSSQRQPCHCLLSVTVEDTTLDVSCCAEPVLPAVRGWRRQCQCWLAAPNGCSRLGGIAPFPPGHSGHLGLKVYRAALQQTLIDFSQVAAQNRIV